MFGGSRYVDQNSQVVICAPQVENRVMQLWKAGSIDRATALQLLGTEHPSSTPSSDVVKPKSSPTAPASENPESKKRPLENADREPAEKESLDEVLDQVEKNRKEPQPYMFIFSYHRSHDIKINH